MAISISQFASGPDLLNTPLWPPCLAASVVYKTNIAYLKEGG